MAHWVDHDDRATAARRKAKLARSGIVRAFWRWRHDVNLAAARQVYVGEVSRERAGWVAPVPVREVNRDA